MKTKNIRIIDYIYWDSVYWRPKWNEIKEEIIKYYEMWIIVNIDFFNIKSVTHSFIDELIWAFIFYDAEKALERIKFKNCSNDIQNMIKFVVRDRLIENKIIN